MLAVLLAYRIWSARRTRRPAPAPGRRAPRGCRDLDQARGRPVPRAAPRRGSVRPAGVGPAAGGGDDGGPAGGHRRRRGDRGRVAGSVPPGGARAALPTGPARLGPAGGDAAAVAGRRRGQRRRRAPHARVDRARGLRHCVRRGDHVGWSRRAALGLGRPGGRRGADALAVVLLALRRHAGARGRARGHVGGARAGASRPQVVAYRPGGDPAGRGAGVRRFAARDHGRLGRANEFPASRIFARRLGDARCVVAVRPQVLLDLGRRAVRGRHRSGVARRVRHGAGRRDRRADGPGHLPARAGAVGAGADPAARTRAAARRCSPRARARSGGRI